MLIREFVRQFSAQYEYTCKLNEIQQRGPAEARQGAR